jgi:glucan-binding YG repeat protein
VITLYRGSKVKNANKMTGWQHLYGADGTNMLYNTYYLDDKTLPVTGVQKIGKNYYYFNSVGLMQHGSFTSDGEYDAWVTNSTGTRYYTLSANRKYSYLSVGFQEIGEDLYYFSKSGYLQRCTSQNSNEDYAIKLIDLDYYAIDREGRVVRGTWMNLDGADCYFNSEGKMCTDGTHKVDGSYYLFNYDGSLIRGESEEPQLVTYDGNQYLVDNNGIVVTDTLLPFGSYKCYFDSRGKMAQDEVVTIGGKKYYFNVNGYMVRGRAAWIDGKRYYFNKNGTMRINGTVIWKNYKFRCGPDGVMTKIRKVK